MEKFDIEKLREIQSNKKLGSPREKDTSIMLHENPESFQRDSFMHGGKLKTSQLFFKDSLKIKKEGDFFNGFPVGIHRSFDEEGRRIHETDFDAAFPFSLEDVRNKIIGLCQKDILVSSQNIGVWRGLQPYAHYIISIPVSLLPKGDMRKIKINAASGEIESDEIIAYSE